MGILCQYLLQQLCPWSKSGEDSAGRAPPMASSISSPKKAIGHVARHWSSSCTPAWHPASIWTISLPQGSRNKSPTQGRRFQGLGDTTAICAHATSPSHPHPRLWSQGPHTDVGLSFLAHPPPAPPLLAPPGCTPTLQSSPLWHTGKQEVVENFIDQSVLSKLGNQAPVTCRKTC